MIEKYYYEFSKIYGRLMRLELQIKQGATTALVAYYGENILEVFSKFLYNKDRLARYNSTKGNPIHAILKNPQMTCSQKFSNVVNKLYLSDTLFLITCCKQFMRPEIAEKFYFKIPEKFKVFREKRQALCDLRNAIAHYNIKDYEKYKQEYLSILLLFEVHVGRYTTFALQLPKFAHKPSIKDILLEISNIRPDLIEIDPKRDDEIEYSYNKHRILVDLVDEIALYNNYSANDLPSPWTILRAMYALKKDLKSTVSDEANVPVLQMQFDL